MSGTRWVDAVGHGFPIGSNDSTPTDRAPIRHLEKPLVARAPAGDDAHDLRNHLAGPLYDHPVADAQVFGPDVVLVVKVEADVPIAEIPSPEF